MSDQPIIVKRVRKKAEGHHGGSWKVAFADFMTAMMAFFLVMWIIGLDQETRSSIAGYFQDPVNFMKKQTGARLDSVLEASPATIDPKNMGASTEGTADEARQRDAERAELEEIQEKINKEVGADIDLRELAEYIETKMTEEGLRIEFVEGAGSVFFVTGRAEVRPLARELFVKLGHILAESKRNLVVDGHTDARPYGAATPYNNWNLSQDRARSTLQVLQVGGVSDEQVLSVRGFADRRLKHPADPLHFSNRRVTVLLPFRWTEERVVGSAGNLDRPIEGVIRSPVDIRNSPQ